MSDQRLLSAEQMHEYRKLSKALPYGVSLDCDAPLRERMLAIRALLDHIDALTEQLKDRQRLFDLVRYCRHQLFEEGLITPDEFSDILVGGSKSAADGGSVRRLESYDEMRARLEHMSKEHK